jgi:amylosucrase
MIDDLAVLYGVHPLYPALLERLDKSLRATQARPDGGPAPGWVQRPDAIGYSAYADKFAKTLTGVEEKLDYLRELGVTYLHLLPIFETPNGDHDGGFAVSDHRRINPQLGTLDDLERLCTAARDRGITICLDIVCNHTASDHEWAASVRRGEETYRDYYHVFPDRMLPDMFEPALEDIFPTTAPGNFSYVEEIDGWVWTTFHSFQWDLNYANPLVFAELVETILFYARLGVGVFRLDAVAMIWKQPGTNCCNLPQVHTLLRALRAVLVIAAPWVVLKAEAVMPAAKAAAYLDGSCEIAYNCSFMVSLWAALGLGDTSCLAATLRNTPKIAGGGTWLIYLRCHDDIRWDDLGPELDPKTARETIRRLANFFAGDVSEGYARGKTFQASVTGRTISTSGTLAALAGLQAAQEADNAELIDLAVRRILLLHGVLLALPGIPVLFMGDELGLNNAEALGAIDGRELHRPIMPWDQAEARHLPGTVPQRIFSGLQAMIARRARLAACHASAPMRATSLADGAVLQITRGWDEGLTVLANFSAQEKTINAPAAQGGAPIILPGFACLWLTPR